MDSRFESKLPPEKNRFGIQGSQYIIFIYCLLSGYCLLFFFTCTEQEKVFKESRIAMDTITSITVVSPSREKAKEAIDAGFAEIKRLENLVNYYSSESEITRLNKAAGMNAVKVSKDTLDILKKSLFIADTTDGAFNPAIGPVMKLWKFSRQISDHSTPPENSIADRLKLVDYRKIRIDEDASEVYLKEEGMEINLGGIAKGYAADRAIEEIRKKGIKSVLVAVAGDIKGVGTRPDGQLWKVGIQDPRVKKKRPEEDEDRIFATLLLKDRAISTSGDYQRFFIKDGKRYHHIIDPKTGYPASSSVISVSVIAPEGFLSDGLSTGIFILSPEEGIAFLESMAIDGIIVDTDKRVYMTKNLTGKINIINKEYQLTE